MRHWPRQCLTQTPFVLMSLDELTTNLAAARLAPAAFATARLLGLILLTPALATVLSWRHRILLGVLLGGVAGSVHGTLEIEGPWLPAFAFELLFGAILGFCINVFVSGLRFGGDLLDAQFGTTDATATSPFEGSDEIPAGPAARLLAGLAVATVLFAITPQGRMPLLEGIFGSFQHVPPGQALAAATQASWLLGALQGASDLAIRTILPLISILAIVAWAQALVSRTAPHMPAGTIATAIRPLLGLAILVATLGGLLDATTDASLRWLEQLPSATR